MRLAAQDTAEDKETDMGSSWSAWMLSSTIAAQRSANPLLRDCNGKPPANQQEAFILKSFQFGSLDIFIAPQEEVLFAAGQQ